MLPLMDIVFGKFVTTFNDFATGRLSPEGFRQEVSKYTYATKGPSSHRYVTGLLVVDSFLSISS
jgi:hypothetical protein